MEGSRKRVLVTSNGDEISKGVAYHLAKSGSRLVLVMRTPLGNGWEIMGSLHGIEPIDVAVDKAWMLLGKLDALSTVTPMKGTCKIAVSWAAAYGSSLAAIQQLVRLSAMEIGKHKIRVNAIARGLHLGDKYPLHVGRRRRRSPRRGDAALQVARPKNDLASTVLYLVGTTPLHDRHDHLRRRGSVHREAPHAVLHVREFPEFPSISFVFLLFFIFFLLRGVRASRLGFESRVSRGAGGGRKGGDGGSGARPLQLHVEAEGALQADSRREGLHVRLRRHPYDLSHIGHARAYVAFDVLHRYLKHLGYEIKYVRNFTDIDDKIIKRANEAGEDPLSLSSRFSKEFLDDMAVLQCLPPTHEPRVTDHIEQIKDMIAKIIDNGHAYTLEGDVYFSVDSFPDYCRLSGRKLDDNLAGGGGRASVDLRKRNPADFALWKVGSSCLTFSICPFKLLLSLVNQVGKSMGPGRPGWHIECSAMSSYYLGHAFDIHGGGKDLIFPHHENELAQSRAACPESNVNYWMHNGFVNRDNQKMSKSDNNFFTIRDIIEKYHPLALRFFLMRTHYRADVNYSDRQLDTASDRVFYIYQTIHDCEKALSPFREGNIKGQIPDDIRELVNKFPTNFTASMSDDLHTTAVLDDLMEPLKAINSNLKKFKLLLSCLLFLFKRVRSSSNRLFKP
uniref:cysteine--tRNA ligase n=1 Tax=Ananas comosus var. bracteatus TaxID=296719 RepID=A0A6V7QSJ9_ANACO